VTAYITRLKEAVERDAEEHQSLRVRQVDETRERFTPLQDRLVRLLATIPPEVQREGLSLPALQVSLRGRSRGACHPGELGTALRRLGFVRRRKWSNVNGFRALWCLTKGHS
jgi:hypothetical protein